MPPIRLLAVAAAGLATAAHADHVDAPQRDGGIVTIVGGRASSLPTTIPTTIEGITGDEIKTKINATDSEDALRYLPSLLVRKRYPGDYNHAVLSSRASGTGNSARSMVYADGILLSNYLGNGATFAPRWGMVSPEEIDRVDVLYGPFSAAYPGNSVGAVVDYVTRMPKRFEAHAKVGAFTQPFGLYATDTTSHGWDASASIGSRAGAFAWWVDVSRLDSVGQPLTFATKPLAATTATPGTPVDGAVAGRDKSDAPWWLIGDGTRYATVQDHAKLKLALDLGASVRAQYTLGWWHNDAVGQSSTYLRRRDDGTPFYSGVARIDGRDYAVGAADFAQTRDTLSHAMHGLTVQSRDGDAFDWDVAASLYGYARDVSRMPTTPKPAADAGGAGRVTDLGGTGWDTLALRGTWRPAEAHRVDLGLQQERYRWRQRIDSAADWIGGARTGPVGAFEGNTRLRSLWAQDTWTIDPRWRAVVGLRQERWDAWGGQNTTNGQTLRFADRSDGWTSPKAAIGFQAADEWSLKLSIGRAVRVPTVGELYQGSAQAPNVNDPALRPEKSWTGELSSEWTIGLHRLRATLFHETTTDALYAQAIPGTTPVVNSVQNVDRIRTTGFEVVADAHDPWVRGLDLQGGITYADSRIVANGGYVSTPGDTIGKRQPRVPRWRASALASWRATDRLTASLGARYGSEQYGTLNNSDPNGFAYQGFSRFFTTDLRLHWQVDRRWSAAFGIDNLNNDEYWNFHPYPQRTYNAELRFDL